MRFLERSLHILSVKIVCVHKKPASPLGENATRFLTSGFFHESVSPKPLSIPKGPFRIFSKIHGDFRSSRCTTGVVRREGGRGEVSRNDEVVVRRLLLHVRTRGRSGGRHRGQSFHTIYCRLGRGGGMSSYRLH